ncbi:MAG TPA: hypothetical protein DCM05_18215 [Elusimicrobia bacterium]|nr:hypothetical protein [Elusimicrobiota bacterium]
MRLEEDPFLGDWLEGFAPSSEAFDWDEGNQGKNLRHSITDAEIESLLWRREFTFAGRILEPAHAEWRGLILGLAENGRLWALIFTLRQGRIRPISCRPARDTERRLYEARIKQEEGGGA